MGGRGQPGQERGPWLGLRHLCRVNQDGCPLLTVSCPAAIAWAVCCGPGQLAEVGGGKGHSQLSPVSVHGEWNPAMGLHDVLPALSTGLLDVTELEVCVYLCMGLGVVCIPCLGFPY